MVEVDYRTGIDYTTFAEIDVGATFTVVGPNKVTGHVNSASAARLRQDEGGNVITAAFLRQKVVISSVSAILGDPPSICLFSVQTVDEHAYGPNGKKASLFIQNNNDDTRFRFYLRASIGVIDVFEFSPVWRTAPATYYIHIEAHDSWHEITATIYYDDQFSNPVETITLTDFAWLDGPWRYFYPLNNYNGVGGTVTTFELDGNDTEYADLAASFNAEQPHGEEDLPCEFFVTRYRTPRQIATEDGIPLWGAILCIDPNGLRADQKGPIYFLLDTCILRTGLTDKSGGFAATINDNKTSIDKDGFQKRIYDMTLFEADSIYIRDNDEFWIGVQQGTVGSGGPVLDDVSGLQNSWELGTGGRYWFMGGWITKRFYAYDEKTRIIANLEGKDYMDLWKESFFGSDDIPRDYTEDAVDILQVVVDILHDMNAEQETNWEFRSHPNNFPGSPLTADVISADLIIPVESTTPFSNSAAFIWDNETRTGESVTITNVDPVTLQLTILAGLTTGFSVGENAWIVMSSELTGTLFLKAFNNNVDFSTLRDLCERADYEWKIAPYPAGSTPAARRALEFYPRSTAPNVSGNARYIRYETNIRQLPSIMVGDTTNLVTNALITGKPITLPEDTWRWINTGLWPDKSKRNRYYSVASSPFPPNAHSNAFADASLILDDESHPALNIQKDDENIFNIFLSFYSEGTNIDVATLDVDLRKWRRLKFRFRHRTAESASIPLTVVNWANLTGHTIIVTATSVAAEAVPRVYYLVEGVDWIASGNNDTTAESIRAAINGLAWTSATRVGAVVTATGAVTGFLSYIASTAAGADLGINISGANIYRIHLHTYNPVWAGTADAWNQSFKYDFGTGAKQSSPVFNDPVVSNHDIVTARLWSEIDLLLPEVNPDGTIGDGTLGIYDDTYMHGWEPVFLSIPLPSPSTTADPTNIDFVGFYVNCAERGPGGTATDAPGAISRNLGGTNKNFVATLALAAPAAIGDTTINVTNAERMAGDYAVGPIPQEARIFGNPYPEYFIWRNLGAYEVISIAAVAGAGSFYPGGDNVLLLNPLQNAYLTGELLCRGGWNISFSQFHFAPGSINKEASLPANLANPKRFRLISSDEAEYMVDVEGLADQTLLDATALQALKISLDGDPRRRIGLRAVPYLDPARFAAGLPTTFHGINTVIDSAEHQVIGVDFISTLVLGPLDSRVRERLLAMIAGSQELKLQQTSYGIRGRRKFQDK